MLKMLQVLKTLIRLYSTQKNSVKKVPAIYTNWRLNLANNRQVRTRVESLKNASCDLYPVQPCSDIKRAIQTSVGERAWDIIVTG